MRELEVIFSTSQKGQLYASIYAETVDDAPVSFLRPNVTVVFKDSGRTLECDARYMRRHANGLLIALDDA